MKLASIIAAFLLLNIAVSACTPRITGGLCSAAETQDALQQLLRDELSREVAALGGSPDRIPGFSVPIAHIVVVTLDAEADRVECSAGIGETGAEIRYTVAPDLVQRGRYVYRLTYVAPTAAWEVLRAVGDAGRTERDGVETQVEPDDAVGETLSPDILALIERERAANTVCRGSIGEEAERACERRAVLSDQLNQHGMCYGREHEFGYQMEWHLCGPNSIQGADLAEQQRQPIEERPHPMPDLPITSTEDRVEYQGPPNQSVGSASPSSAAQSEESNPPLTF